MFNLPDDMVERVNNDGRVNGSTNWVDSSAVASGVGSGAPVSSDAPVVPVIVPGAAQACGSGRYYWRAHSA